MCEGGQHHLDHQKYYSSLLGLKKGRHKTKIKIEQGEKTSNANKVRERE